MRKDLPARPSLEHLKAQAKELLRAYHEGDPVAVQRFRDALPAARSTELALHDAQSVIAREYGHASWRELREAVARERAASGAPIELVRALMSSPLPAEVTEALRAAMGDVAARELSLPATLPVVPVRNHVITAGALVPLQIGRPSTIAAVEAASSGDKLLAAFAQKDDSAESPGGADLHAVGCAVELAATLDVADRGRWVVVRGLAWIQLDALEPTDGYLTARVARFEIQPAGAEAEELVRQLRVRVRAAAERLPGGTGLLPRIEAMSPAELADATVANLACSVQEKARYAAEPTLSARLARAIELLDAD